MPSIKNVSHLSCIWTYLIDLVFQRNITEVFRIYDTCDIVKLRYCQRMMMKITLTVGLFTKTDADLHFRFKNKY